MRVELQTPAPSGSRHGNRVTALRWAAILRQLGHRVEIRGPEEQPQATEPDLLLALHARRSFSAISRFRRKCPGRPLVVALTGTDLYRDIHTSKRARQALEWSDRLVLLQAAGIGELDPSLRSKARVIHQSAAPLPRSTRPSKRTFDICVVGHLRAVKDPFRPARAAASLPRSSRIRVVHAGGAMTRRMRERALREAARNSRYRWLGEIPRWRVRRLLGRSRLMVLPSLLEGGANVLSEALVGGLPVLASRIPGSIGILGPDHPGFFEVRQTGELARLMERCERDPEFCERLAHRSRRLADNFRPTRERRAWRELLRELVATPQVARRAER